MVGLFTGAKIALENCRRSPIIVRRAGQAEHRFGDDGSR
jgi:hypothetical protein